MVKQGIIGWGVFGAAVGAITGFAGNGGILSSVENAVVVGVAWAIFGVFAGSLYGLWAGRAVSARRLSRSWAADPAGQLGDPRLGRREPRYGTNPPHTVDARCGDAWRAVQPRRAGRDSGGLRTMTAQRAA